MKALQYSTRLIPQLLTAERMSPPICLGEVKSRKVSSTMLLIPMGTSKLSILIYRAEHGVESVSLRGMGLEGISECFEIPIDMVCEHRLPRSPRGIEISRHIHCGPAKTMWVA